MKNGVWIWLAIILLVVIVLIDWYVPLGTAVGVLYLFVIVLVSRERKRVNPPFFSVDHFAYCSQPLTIGHRGNSGQCLFQSGYFHCRNFNFGCLCYSPQEIGGAK